MGSFQKRKIKRCTHLHAIYTPVTRINNTTSSWRSAAAAAQPTTRHGHAVKKNSWKAKDYSDSVKRPTKKWELDWLKVEGQDKQSIMRRLSSTSLFFVQKILTLSPLIPIMSNQHNLTTVTLFKIFWWISVISSLSCPSYHCYVSYCKEGPSKTQSLDSHLTGTTLPSRWLMEPSWNKWR